MSRKKTRIFFCVGLAGLVLAFSCTAAAARLASDEPITPAERNSAPRQQAPSHLTTNSTSSAQAPEPERQDRALREEQVAAARQLYRDFPCSDAAFAMGMVCNEQGDTEAAIRYWREETRMAPDPAQIHDRAEAFANLGDVLKLKPDYEQAEQMYRESLRLNPRRSETHFRLARLYYDQDRMTNCLQVLNEGRVASAKAYSLRGQACQRLGDLAEARRHFERALREDPNLADAYYGLAITCARLGEQAKADEYSQKFRDIKSGHQAAGRQARMEYDPLAATLRSLAQSHTEVGWVYLAHGKPELAEKLWLRAAEADTSNTACRFQLMMLYQKARRNPDALRMCREMIRAEPANGFHYLGLGNLHARLNQRAEAESAFLKATTLIPERPEGYFALAQFYLQEKTHAAEALKLSRRAVELAPVAPHYYVLGQACARNGDLPAARAAMARACELDPTAPQYKEFRASLPPEK